MRSRYEDEKYDHHPKKRRRGHYRQHKQSSSSIFVALLFASGVCIIPVASCMKEYPTDYSYRYVPDIEDLPIPRGFEYRSDLSMSYDTAGGRIVDTYLEGEDNPENIINFYSEVLPELGWKKTSVSLFERDGEEMQLNIYPKDHRMMLHFTIQPSLR